MIPKSLLYADIIEHDGRVHSEPTFLGVALLIAAALVIVNLLFLGIGWAIAIFS